MSDAVKVPEASLEALRNAEKQIRPLMDQYNAMLHGVKTALEAPDNYVLDLEKGEFVTPPSAENSEAAE